MAVLTRAWQLLLKGLGEVKDAPRPLAAADMVLVRLAYAADLPPPDEVLRRLSGSAPAGLPSGGAGRRAAAAVRVRGRRSPWSRRCAMAAPQLVPPAQPAATAAAPRRALGSFEDIVALCAEKRDIQLKTALERDVHLVRFDEGSIEFSLAPGASPALPQALMRKLREWTGTRWIVTLSRDPGAPSLKQQADAREKAAIASTARRPAGAQRA